MDVINLINKYKEHVLNIIIIIIALIIAFNNFKAKTRDLVLLKAKLNTEVKKNDVLKDVSRLGEITTSLKNNINNKAISSVINTLGNIANEAGVKIILIKPYNENYQGVYTRYPFESVVSSNSYHGVGKFISLIENSPDIYTVENLVITSNPKEGEDRILTKLILNTILINN
jgi:Tfp pilus assembly protein PilO